MNKLKLILLITVLFYIGYCIYIQSITGKYHLGDNKFLNPFLYQEGTIKNPYVDYHFDRRAEDFREDVIDEEQLQVIKFKKMAVALEYILPIIIITSFIYFRKFKLKKNEKIIF